MKIFRRLLGKDDQHFYFLVRRDERRLKMQHAITQASGDSDHKKTGLGSDGNAR